MKIYYTHKERTVRDTTLQHIVDNAEVYLAQRKVGICMDAVHAASADRLYTMEEGNQILERIIDDSLYYAGRW